MRKVPTTPLGRALLGDKEIKLAILRNEVIDICLEEGLITQLDIKTNSKEHQWVNDIIEDHCIGSGLLKRLMFDSANADDRCDLLKSIIRAIVERLLNHQQPFPRRL
ncbi:Transcriptional regulator [Vibrio crassostreae]|uniref:hypothetical protein n=1 Tax=Vibrio crassostreae TaxID=246167 RepID=UPI00104F0E5D|nr:hypothetical protein [Vibrio crassostreae]TCN81971.1 hypothetical protein EDB37_102461 [Vibrio crassostreae]CAK2459588.1 Transcriptional regulator [Vibrio crassostreae]CAK3748249.1 Transcriptional regulator [Vibrio crassostreae]CAK3871459.1 Transcriptional regulator [Vibrio crassostreae]